MLTLLSALMVVVIMSNISNTCNDCSEIIHSSLLREFIGWSVFEHKHLEHTQPSTFFYDKETTHNTSISVYHKFIVQSAYFIHNSHHSSNLM